jgi:hypothetical protein
MPGSVQTNDLGIAFVSVRTGDASGGYAYTANCPSCQRNSSVDCIVLADLPPFMEAKPSDEGPAAGNPDVTPMLRISNIGYPNDGVSFTTLFGENKVNLAADLKPDTPEHHALSEDIAWEVVDSPADAMDSGNPAPPANGAATYFYVNHPHVPPAPTGRQFPLKYKIQARVTTSEGLVIESYPRHIRQDDIDKCRQEYIDFEAPIAEAPRSAFTPGVPKDSLFGDYSQDVESCHAYIYPAAEAQKVSDLRATGYTPRVTSGYRSPRSQFLLTKKRDAVKNSTHIYGQAVDIAPQWADKNAAGWKALWTAPAATCPKSLEFSKTGVMMWCNGNQQTPVKTTNYPGSDEVMYQRATCIHLGNASKTLENTQ